MSYANLGFNIGNDVNGATPSYPTTQNTNDLAYLRQYISKLRVKLEYHLDTVGVGYTKTLALAAKAAGFKVQWGVTAGATDSTANYNTWKNTSVPAAAAWANTNGIDLFLVGNEEDWNAQSTNGFNVSDGQVRTDVLALVASTKAAYPNMKVGYCSAQGTVLGWQSKGLGQMDQFGLNMYDTNANFLANIPYFISMFGTKLFVSEWACNGPYPADDATAALYEADMAARLAILKKYALECYAFTWRSATDTDWNMVRRDSSFRPGIRSVFETYRMFDYGARAAASTRLAASARLQVTRSV